jgi:hypothetical protein
VAGEIGSALRAAEQYDDPILITGSLFLVGEALAYFEGGGSFEPSTQ